MAQTTLPKTIQADRSMVVGELASLLPLTSDTWFPQGNDYLDDPQAQIRADNNNVPLSRRSHFLRYVAASSFVHCGDAWSYLGRSLDALIRGDLTGSIHLLYYAELRAAISLLASEGIFIGNRHHLTVDANDTHHLSTEGTHRAVWQILERWAQENRSLDLLYDVFRPGRSPFSDWMQRLTPLAARAKIEQLLEVISFDLKSFDTDHKQRNRASYQPTRLKPRDVDSAAVQSLVSETWRYLEPGPGGAFPVLDDALLPEMLTAIFHSRCDPTPPWIDWVTSITPPSLEGSALAVALQDNDKRTNDSTLLGALYPAENSETDAVKCIRPMTARAVVLLRIATGSCVSLLRDSGHDTNAISAWTTSLAVGRGLWSPGKEPSNRLDLWADIEIALEEINAATPTTRSDFLRTLPTSLLALGQAERVPVWSFA
ncbi:MAG: hypothetical protein B5766_03965 [Candidatus Lumbricidophila eiseniae]|uniref:Uncharacterized protein n=1 Tax=Candidatus Lumbricidiphila eiseniae TaxID=1969409 RepID=A0A2A6FT45_9MICO|nr:MAG: hypothetical protein B5766_03965 [Candidatus Lumbricidophila eiseniae]